MPGRSGDWWLVTSHSQLLIPNPFLQTFSGGFAAKKEANPASLRSAAPSKGRGSRGHSLLPMEGGAPKGRRLDGESGMKKSGGDRLKSTIYESTLSTADAVPLPRWGRQRGGGFAAKKEANPASLRSAAPSKGRGSRGHSLLPMEGGAPKGAEVGWRKAVFSYQSLPRMGKVASGASQIGLQRYEKAKGAIFWRENAPIS